MSVHAALLSRHSKDVIVGECKDGPTMGGGHLRLDYWVLRRSWVKPAMIGYEVKSSRRDWLSDMKWMKYLPLCNELWFIAEDASAIGKDELPESVGLLRLAGSRLMTVRRAAWREIAPPIDLLTYVIMCRSRITNDRDGPGQAADSAVEWWKNWLEERTTDREIGWRVGKKLREKFDREVGEVRRENAELMGRIEKLEGIKAALEAKGIAWDAWIRPDQIVEEVLAPRWTKHNVAEAHAALGKLLNGES